MLMVLSLSVLTMVGPPSPGNGDELGICRQGGVLPVLERPTAPAGGRDLTDTDVLHYDLDIEIVPSTEWLGGSNTMTVRSLVSGLTTFEVRLRDNFTISEVSVNGFVANWQRLSGSTIEVELDHAYTVGEEFDLYIAYDGNPVSLGFGSINFDSRGGYPLVYTLSEPWYAYTWWPAKDDNNDKAAGDFKLTVPDTLTVAGNGVLVAVENVGGGRSRHHWSTGYQTATYLFSFSAAYYNTFGDTYNYDGGSMPLEFFIFPDSDTAGHRADWRKSVDMLVAFAPIYGLYPFINEKYGIYQFGFGGGMEHQTMTGQGGFGEWLTAHEIGHQWWGDMITCGTWQDIWLNEGFATYSEALWVEFKPGSSGLPALHDYMDGRRPSSVDGSVYVPAEDADDPSRIFSGNFSYRKGAWVLHQLRHVVGDETFFDILHAYREAFEFDSAITEDLRMIAESVHGADLTWFFDEWVYDIGAPAYRNAWRPIDLGGRSFVELYIAQVQSSSYPIFAMPLDIALVGTGTDTIVVWNDEQAEHFLLEVAGGIGSVNVDPDDWTLHTSNQTTTFVEGPPKIAFTNPEPGGSIESTAPPVIEVVFHKDVVVDGSAFSLTGDATGSVPLDFAYSAASQTVTLTSIDPLPADSYTLTVSDSIIDVAAGLALDGEVTDPESASSLPSGEGLPGGDAVIRFSVVAGELIGDVNDDGVVDILDLLAVLSAWGPCSGCPEDIDGNGEVDVLDLLAVLANWT